MRTKPCSPRHGAAACTPTCAQQASLGHRRDALSARSADLLLQFIPPLPPLCPLQVLKNHLVDGALLDTAALKAWKTWKTEGGGRLKVGGRAAEVAGSLAPLRCGPGAGHPGV